MKKKDKLVEDCIKNFIKTGESPTAGFMCIADSIRDAYEQGFEDGQADAIEVVGDFKNVDFEFNHDAGNFIDGMHLNVDDVKQKWLGLIDLFNEDGRQFKITEALEYIANVTSDPRMIMALTLKFASSTDNT